MSSQGHPSSRGHKRPFFGPFLELIQYALLGQYVFSQEREKIFWGSLNVWLKLENEKFLNRENLWKNLKYHQCNGQAASDVQISIWIWYTVVTAIYLFFSCSKFWKHRGRRENSATLSSRAYRKKRNSSSSELNVLIIFSYNLLKCWNRHWQNSKYLKI